MNGLLNVKPEFSLPARINKGIIQCFDKSDNYIMKNYEMKHYREYYLFCKRELNDNDTMQS